ncbi:MAG: zf-TFIIB domain-containing protein [Deltaproteobacteria bacterium]|nr:zf-TFIIB domain-containing protein [Deltaproteobacteria bacterium]MBW2418924.1 zf-TFIIB domain-containing protein [Deltaproteobacteria bacterium]
MALNKPSIGENESVTRLQLIRRKLAEMRGAEQGRKLERERQRVLHHDMCPSCGSRLSRARYRDRSIARCGDCRGAWLSEEDLLGLVGRDWHTLRDIERFFEKVSHATPISELWPWDAPASPEHEDQPER